MAEKNRPGRGWIRLGLALSFLWLVVSVTYATFDFWRVSSAESGWETAGGHSNTLPLTIPISLFTECRGYGGNVVVTTCSPRYLNIAFLMFGPIALGWPLILACVNVALWVREGFQRDNTNDQLPDIERSNVPTNPTDYSWLVFVRHAVAGLLVMVLQPPIYVNSHGLIGVWLGSYIAVLLFASVITGLVVFFFTRRELKRVKRTFVTCMWFFIGIYMLDGWWLRSNMA